MPNPISEIARISALRHRAAVMADETASSSRHGAPNTARTAFAFEFVHRALLLLDCSDDALEEQVEDSAVRWGPYRCANAVDPTRSMNSTATEHTSPDSDDFARALAAPRRSPHDGRTDPVVVRVRPAPPPSG